MYGDNLAASFVWFPFGCCSSLWLASSSVIFGVTVGAAHNFVALWAGSTFNVVIGRYFFREPIRERLFDGDFPASRPHDNVHLLPKELGGKVAKMHFSLLGAELIVLVGSAAGTMAFLASGGASGSFMEDNTVWQQRQVPWRFSPVEVPQIQFSTTGWTFLFGNRDRYHGTEMGIFRSFPAILAGLQNRGLVRASRGRRNNGLKMFSP